MRSIEAAIARILPIAFVIGSVLWLLRRTTWPAEVIAPGSDARVYYRATELWLAGGDPLAATIGPFHYASPPPTLLVMAPFTLLSETLAAVVIVVGSLGLAAWTLRRLGLPLWWLLFPPLFQSVYLGSLNVAALALLLVSGPLATTLAVFVKPYAIVPAVLLRRWRAVLLTGIALVVTFPLLPWAGYLENGAQLVDEQSVGYSATSVPALVPFVLVALWVLGRARLPWLAVPALWPSSQMTYGILALPAMTPVLALMMCFFHPLATPLGIIAAALVEVVRSRRSSAGIASSPQPSASLGS